MHIMRLITLYYTLYIKASSEVLPNLFYMSVYKSLKKAPLLTSSLNNILPPSHLARKYQDNSKNICFKYLFNELSLRVKCTSAALR